MSLEFLQTNQGSGTAGGDELNNVEQALMSQFSALGNLESKNQKATSDAIAASSGPVMRLARPLMIAKWAAIIAATFAVSGFVAILLLVRRR
ncbi:MAG: hypothetical protein ACYCWW_00095 [Deltaproteobacteria bacterium]